MVCSKRDTVITAVRPTALTRKSDEFSRIIRGSHTRQLTYGAHTCQGHILVMVSLTYSSQSRISRAICSHGAPLRRCRPFRSPPQSVKSKLSLLASDGTVAPAKVLRAGMAYRAARSERETRDETATAERSARRSHPSSRGPALTNKISEFTHNTNKSTRSAQHTNCSHRHRGGGP